MTAGRELLLLLAVTQSAIHPKERLMQAAQTLFAKRGYRGTGVQDIVELAGVTKPTLYYYFESKAGIYLKLVEQIFDLRLDLVKQAASTEESIQGKLTAIIITLMEYSRTHHEGMQIAYANIFAAPEEVPSEVRGCHKIQGTFDFVHDLIKQGQENGELDPTFDSSQLTSAIYGHFIVAASTLSLNPERWQPNWADNMVKIFLQGARNKSAGYPATAASAQVGA